MNSFSGSINLLKLLTELRKTLKFISLLKDLIKVTKQQPDEEIQSKAWDKGEKHLCPLQEHHLPKSQVLSKVVVL